MPFGIVGQMGPGIRQIVGFGDLSMGRGTFEGEFRVRHCNQWGLYGIRVRQRRNAAFYPNYFGQTCYHCEGDIVDASSTHVLCFHDRTVGLTDNDIHPV